MEDKTDEREHHKKKNEVTTSPHWLIRFSEAINPFAKDAVEFCE